MSPIDGRLAALSKMFRVAHNVPSTPARALAGDVAERTIWGYWAQGEVNMPPFFQSCVETWRRFNPHWDIRILEKSTVHDYLSEADLPNRWAHLLSHQIESDAIRLALLSRYGGVWIDVSVILRTPLDELCWDEICAGEVPAAAFFHGHYGTEAFGGKDFTESWFLATRSNNPFFMQWRDLLKELLHNRLDLDGLSAHPLYCGLDLAGFDKLNVEFKVSGMNFREYLAIHVMCHRLLEKNRAARSQWRSWKKFDAADSAFKLQLAVSADKTTEHLALVLLGNDPRWEATLEGVPLIKFTTPHYGSLLFVAQEHLTSKDRIIGRLLASAPEQRERASSGDSVD